MSEIQSGFVTALYLFDVARSIDLVAIEAQVGGQAARASLGDKSAGPSRSRYVTPPLVVDGHVLGCTDVDGFRSRVKFYDYGVVSLTLTRAFSGSWADLVALGQTLIENEPLEEHAARTCDHIVSVVASSLADQHRSFLSEDYLVFAVTALETPSTSQDLIVNHGQDIAQLLRGERQRLSAQERDFVLSQSLSYLAEDLVVPAWNAAWIYDTEGAALAAVEILELANSQLLEFRYHDELLEGELTRLYADLQHPRWRDRLALRQRRRAVLEVQSLLIDVNELTDRLENTVKFAGDPYAARLLSNASARLGVQHWKTSVDEKLRTLEDIRRFAVEQTGMSQANLLELIIVAILVIELGLFFAGIMH
ncbi:MAG TPA: hypothetical protein VHB78_10190 [Vicinamibacterales bacterium]|jgi:hypothetical protein|nr:hypothetical protein [Vicinamibacterales bacterium]